MSARLVRARTVVQGSGLPVIDDGAVVIDGGRIVEVDAYRSLRPRGAAETVELPGVLVPGFVDAHSHLRGIPLAEHGIAPRPLEPWLCSLAAMTPLPAGDEAFVAALDLLGTGVTSVQAMVHSFADAEASRAEADAVVDALTRAGIRALVVLGFSDRAERAPIPAGPEWDAVPAVEHAVDASAFAALAADWLDHREPELVRRGVGPVASQWVTDEALRALADLASAGRVHTHLNESAAQRTWVASDPAPVARLDAAGLLGPRLSGAHAVHLSDDELDRIAASGASLVHCPRSNERLEVGTARVAEWLDRGIPSGLGLDSQNDGPSDVFDVMRAAMAGAADRGRPIGADRVLEMATAGGGRCLSVPGLGVIRPGAPADLVGLDLTLSAGASFAAAADAIVATGARSSVRSVVVGGREVVVDGRSATDASAVAASLRALLQADAPARAARLHDLAPAIAAAAAASPSIVERERRG